MLFLLLSIVPSSDVAPLEPTSNVGPVEERASEAVPTLPIRASDTHSPMLTRPALVGMLEAVNRGG